MNNDVHLVTKGKKQPVFFDSNLLLEAQVIMRLKLLPNNKHKTADHCRSTNDFIVTIVY